MALLIQWLEESWRLLADSSVYLLFGLLVGGIFKAFLSPNTVGRHLGKGRFVSVFKAAILGIPMPLCSCGVLPAAASLRRQGANRGATSAFLVSTPETGVDSMAITYALLGPVMTVARPVAAFATAMVAGLTENLLGRPDDRDVEVDASCPIDGCCDGEDCPDEEHRRHHSRREKLTAGLRFAAFELWADLAAWFFVGLLIAGFISAVVPDDVMSRYLGGGWQSMLIMLAVGIPLYICATASTPIAAMLILKGVSPGAALVFLLAGPATNITSMSVLLRVLGKRGAGIYLASIAVMAVASGLALDWLCAWLGWEVVATVGEAAELVPSWLQIGGAFVVILLSIKPIFRTLKAKLSARGQDHHDDHDHDQGPGSQRSAPVQACSGST